jgi:hypothetical protein
MYVVGKIKHREHNKKEVAVIYSIVKETSTRHASIKRKGFKESTPIKQ